MLYLYLSLYILTLIYISTLQIDITIDGVALATISNDAGFLDDDAEKEFCVPGGFHFIFPSNCGIFPTL